MKIAGTYTFDAHRDTVWSALNDIDVLARAIPGCQQLEQIGENTYQGTIKINVGPVKGTYMGQVTLSDINPPHGYRLLVEGKDRNSWIKGEGHVELTGEGHETVAAYAGQAEVGGTIASVGQRLLEGTAKSLLTQSLKSIDHQVRERVIHALAGAAPTPLPEQVITAESVPATLHEPPHPPVPADAALAAPDTLLAEATAATPAVPHRTVVVPPEEQLNPRTVALGMATDFLRDTPWLPWVIIAFLLGYILGRRQ